MTPEYFIGSIVVCPGEGGTLDLIDGQQRMTTLFLTLCAIRDRLASLGASSSGALKNLIAAESVDESGNDRFRYRLDLQYADSGGVLERIAAGTDGDPGDEEPDGSTRSIGNIRRAYATATGFLTRDLGDGEKEIKQFYGYLTNKVKLIRIQTEDVAKALKIFETINDRGVGLDSMDLLKNLLFMKADRGRFEKLKALWKQMQDTIHRAGEKPLRFLRYFIFSRYDVDLLREEEIYSWLSKHPAECGYATDPIKFANELLSAAQAYGNFMDGRDEKGQTRASLESLNILAGTASRQHLILLLAGRRLAGALFDELVRQVEDLLFVYTVTREHTRTFERTFAKWARNLRAVANEAELDAFIVDEIGPAKQALADRFKDAMKRMDYKTLQKYRLRYLLAKITQHVEMTAYGDTEGTRSLGKYMSNEYEIEHIHPSDPSSACKAEFGPSSRADVAQRLGNLILLEKSINASMLNKPYSEKRDVFRHSKLLLTKSLAERPKIGENTKIDQAVRDLPPFTVWNEAAIDKRQDVMAGLAQQVWQIH